VVAVTAQGAAAQTVQWRPDHGPARREASETKRPLVVFFTAGYCPWCHKMDATTFRDAEVIRQLNQEFVPVKVASDEARNSGLVSGHRIQGLPATVLVTPGGQVMVKHEGYLDAAGFLALLKRGRAAAQREPAGRNPDDVSAGPARMAGPRADNSRKGRS
jgi:uncharacterized protein YyaL (SSP411 family)